ncbi:tRNA (guanine-9-) methyltransferase [Anaeramoeba flamelloides]|uniref:tRNA (guanine(9)-N(1))-methyltransferase n=1 Tax=Anaeramoeba flamelloides TaxID=1746091 RepID=A0AAV7ZUV8_9EUKA|nr:tRNA (guanine-9-) methyltransferase [Anaeramoeba flamelloides]
MDISQQMKRMYSWAFVDPKSPQPSKSEIKKLERLTRQKLRKREKQNKKDVKQINKKRRLLNIRENKNSDLPKFSIVIDCSLDRYMKILELTKLINQINLCYGVNNRHKTPSRLWLTGLFGRTKARLELQDGIENWKMDISEKCYTELFPLESLVYLTAEAEETLSEIKTDGSENYIIGGLVDHNRLPGLCHKIAKEKGIRTAKLPIESHLIMKTRKILTVNHVFQSILNWLEYKDWGVALSKAIPLRKNAKIKNYLQLESNNNKKTVLENKKQPRNTNDKNIENEIQKEKPTKGDSKTKKLEIEIINEQEQEKEKEKEQEHEYEQKKDKEKIQKKKKLTSNLKKKKKKISKRKKKHKTILKSNIEINSEIEDQFQNDFIEEEKNMKKVVLDLNKEESWLSKCIIQ